MASWTASKPTKFQIIINKTLHLIPVKTEVSEDLIKQIAVMNMEGEPYMMLWQFHIKQLLQFMTSISLRKK
jgi:hypothetical protein